jgi:hypothetical protein
MSLPNFPFPTISVPGERAEDTLLQMRVELEPLGLLPVIVGEKESASRLTEIWDDDFSFDWSLRLALETKPETWFQLRIDDDPEAFASLTDAEFYPKGAAPMTHLQAGFHFSGKPHKEVFIAQIPTSDYWTIPLHLRFGDWNACPGPSEHAMLSKYWGERYGAKIAALTSDTIEYTVERPPKSLDECTDLAREQYLYCGDIVDQGVGSVPTLAKALQDSSRWFFWWD